MLYISLLICLVVVGQAVAFIPICRPSYYYTTKLQGLITREETCRPLYTTKLQYQTNNDYERRIFMQSIISVAALLPSQPSFAEVLLIDKSSPSLPPFIRSGDSSEARERYKAAIKDVDSLLANYDEITKTGGDNVRLYLGTQGTKSHMFGISKVLKSMKEDVDDIVEYTESINEFEAYLYQAEGAAYQSMFVEHSSAKSTPKSLLKTAKSDILNMRRYMGELAIQLGIDA